jgi:hypothetical protein
LKRSLALLNDSLVNPAGRPIRIARFPGTFLL